MRTAKTNSARLAAPREERKGRALLATLARRAITLPAAFLLAGLMLAAAPLWLPTAAVLDLVLPGRRCVLRLGVMLTSYLLLEVLALLAALLIWLGTGCGLRAGRALRFRGSFAVQRAWAWAQYEITRRLFRLHLEIEGEQLLDRMPPPLLLVRHASMADALLPVLLLAVRRGVHVRYVAKEEQLWDPAMDVVGQWLPNCFVRRGGADTEAALAGIAKMVADLPATEGATIYPEGTRFSADRRDKVLARLAKAGDEALLARARGWRHVLPPRPGGVLTLLEYAPDRDVVVCAHFGFEGTRRLTDLVRGSLLDARVAVKLWRHPRAQVPEGADARLAWLHDRWDEVDAWVTQQTAGGAHERP